MDLYIIFSGGVKVLSEKFSHLSSSSDLESSTDFSQYANTGSSHSVCTDCFHRGFVSFMKSIFTNYEQHVYIILNDLAIKLSPY